MRTHTLVSQKNAAGHSEAITSRPVAAAFERQFRSLDLSVTLGNRRVNVWELREADLPRVRPDDMVRLVKIVRRSMLTTRYRGVSHIATPAQHSKLLKVVFDLCMRQASIQAGKQAATAVRRTMRTAKNPTPDDVVRCVALEVRNTISDYLTPVFEAVKVQPQAPSGSSAVTADKVDPSAPAPVVGNARGEGMSSDIEFGDAGPVSSSMAALSSLLEERRSMEIGELLRQSDMLSSDAFGTKIDLTRQQLNAWRKQRKVLAIEGAKRGLRYPAWQVTDDGRILDGLSEVIAEFDDQHLAAYRFLTTPLEILDGKAPWMLLRDGKRQRIVGLAKAARRGDFF